MNGQLSAASRTPSLSSSSAGAEAQLRGGCSIAETVSKSLSSWSR
jgi:hypothetical protein